MSQIAVCSIQSIWNLSQHEYQIIKIDNGIIIFILYSILLISIQHYLIYVFFILKK